MKATLFLIISIFFFQEVTSQHKVYNYRPDIVGFDSLIHSTDYDKKPGFSLIVIRKDSIIFKRSRGLTNLDNAATLINEHTPFNIASISKTFTASAIMKLREQKKLSLSDPVSKYITELPDYMSPIRIYHLLTHTSGIPDYERAPETFINDNDDAVRLLKMKSDLEFSPLTNYSYSNRSYVLLALVIERVTGMTYSDYLKAVFFDPLQMMDTYVTGDSELNNLERAIGYSLDEESQKYDLNDSIKDKTYGSTGIYSSTSDLFKWYKALKHATILKPSSIRLMFTYPVTTSGQFSYIGMGWFNESLGRRSPSLSGLQKRGAIGVSFGFRGIMEMYIDNDFGYICLSNNGELPEFIGGTLASYFFK